MERNRGSIDAMLMMTGDGLVRSGEMKVSQQLRWLHYARAYRSLLGLRTGSPNSDNVEAHIEILSRDLATKYELATGEGVSAGALKVAEVIAVRDFILQEDKSHQHRSFRA